MPPTEIQWLLMVAEAVIEAMVLGAVLLVALTCFAPMISTSFLWTMSALVTVIGAAAILVVVGFCRKNRQIDSLQYISKQSNVGERPSPIDGHTQDEYDAIVKENDALREQVIELEIQRNDQGQSQKSEMAQVHDEQLAELQMRDNGQLEELKIEKEVENSDLVAKRTDLVHATKVTVTKVAGELLQRQIAVQLNIQKRIKELQEKPKKFKIFKNKSTASDLENEINSLNNLQAKFNDLKTSEIDAKSKIVCQFFDPKYGMFAFIEQLEPKLMGKVLNALASPNYEIAMVLLLRSKEMEIQVEANFFDHLLRRPPNTDSFIALDADEITEKELENINYEKGKNLCLRSFEHGGIEPEIFTDENFSSKLEETIAILDQFLLFKDLIRSFSGKSKCVEIVIDGVKIYALESWSDCSCKRNAIGFFLQELKNSKLSSQNAYNALMSICQVKWVQGGGLRNLIKFNDSLLQNTADTEKNFDKFNAISCGMLPLVSYKIKIEISIDGNVKISSINTMVSSDMIKTVEENSSYIIKTNLNNCLLFAYESMNCDPDGKHSILSTTTIADMF
ncbi:MAG: hypothetical protein LBI69_00890 [Puniceicoccales bacterium]|nr:hypothetical protein [Puniceicoccales bacterium]